MVHLAKTMQDEQIMQFAPSVFATSPAEKMSDQYRFIPTIKVVNALRNEGYQVVKAGQARSLSAEGREYTKHVVRLRHSDYLENNVEDELPELVLTNSHNGKAAYKLMMGIFRLVCSNGLVVASQTIESFSVRHTGETQLVREVIKLSYDIAKEAPKVFNRIADFKGITLDTREQAAFAIAAREALSTKLEIEPHTLLQHRRFADRPALVTGERSLWQTMNVVQENVMKGGIYGKDAKGKRRKAVGIKNIKKDININQALWRLTEEMAKLKK